MDGPRPETETVFGATTAVAGFGILLFAVFPIALPTVILTSLLLAPILPLALVAALLAAMVLALRACGRRLWRIGRARRRPSRTRDGRATAAPPRSRSGAASRSAAARASARRRN